MGSSGDVRWWTVVAGTVRVAYVKTSLNHWSFSKNWSFKVFGVQSLPRQSLKAQEGSKEAILGYSRTSWAILGLSRGHIEPSWAVLSSTWSRTRLALQTVGASVANVNVKTYWIGTIGFQNRIALGRSEVICFCIRCARANFQKTHLHLHMVQKPLVIVASGQ